MLLIFRSSALFSLVKGSFGSLTLFFGMSLARGWRWPIGASGGLAGRGSLVAGLGDGDAHIENSQECK
jgi:hypothetical protein